MKHDQWVLILVKDLLNKILKVHLQLDQILDIQVLDLHIVRNLVLKGLDLVVQNQLYQIIMIHKDLNHVLQKKEHLKVQYLQSK